MPREIYFFLSFFLSFFDLQIKQVKHFSYNFNFSSPCLVSQEFGRSIGGSANNLVLFGAEPEVR